MLTQTDAKSAVKKEYPETRPEVVVSYKGQYLVYAKHGEPDEEDYDPFFSVDPTNGAVKEFSVINDGDITEIMPLFMAAQKSA